MKSTASSLTRHEQTFLAEGLSAQLSPPHPPMADGTKKVGDHLPPGLPFPSSNWIATCSAPAPQHSQVWTLLDLLAGVEEQIQGKKMPTAMGKAKDGCRLSRGGVSQACKRFGLLIQSRFTFPKRLSESLTLLTPFGRSSGNILLASPALLAPGARSLVP